jgi:hypothetical protein
MGLTVAQLGRGKWGVYACPLPLPQEVAWWRDKRKADLLDELVALGYAKLRAVTDYREQAREIVRQNRRKLRELCQEI